ncbi:MAG: nitroreductase family protein [Bacilli bacterium]|nr:nitroreductase family protein [Bacilli bacterium]
MEVKDALLKRRSIRKYLDKEVSDEIIEELLHAAMSGPSACNRKPWIFYVIKDQDKLNELRKASRFSNMNAPLAIVVVGDLSRSLPLQLKDFWIQDCSAATENILLRATDLGLGSLWCGIYPQKRPVERVKKILGITNSDIPLNIIYIGYGDEEKESRDQYEKNRVKVI